MQKSYAVLHILKYKNLSKIGSHIDRKYISKNVNKELDYLNEILGDMVDESRSHLREEGVASKHNDLKKDVEAVISESYKSTNKIRSNAVLALGVILTGSHEKMKEIESDEEKFGNWKLANYEFVCREFGKSNIVRFTLHRDEKTPHYHCVVVPITKDGRLSARDLIGGNQQLKELQDRYAESMRPFGLSRGISSDHTAVHNISTREYYRSISEKKKSIISLLDKINVKNILSLNKIKTQILDELESLVVNNVNQEVALDRSNKRNEIYENKLKEEISKDLDTVKREINLVSLACNYGYQIDKEKSCRSYVTLKKEGEVLVAKAPVGNSCWQYFSPTNSSDKGTVIDFLLNRGSSYQDIRGLLGVKLDSRYDTLYKSLPDTNFSNAEQTRRAKYKLEVFGSTSLVEDHLSSQGIEAKVWSGFNEKEEVLKSKKGETIFSLYKDFNESGHGYLCSTILYKSEVEGVSRKYFQRGLPRGIVLLGNVSSCSKVMVTESPIDALSHKSLYPDTNIAYISTCGSLTQGIKKDIATLSKLAFSEGKEVVLSFDKDQAGDYMSSELGKVLNSHKVDFKVEQPSKGKDWHEYLSGKMSSGLGMLKGLLSSSGGGTEEGEDINENNKMKKGFV